MPTLCAFIKCMIIDYGIIKKCKIYKRTWVNFNFIRQTSGGACLSVEYERRRLDYSSDVSYHKNYQNTYFIF